MYIGNAVGGVHTDVIGLGGRGGHLLLLISAWGFDYKFTDYTLRTALD